MLVLTRKLGEKIMIEGIEGHIHLTVLAVKSGTVRIGVEAPRSVLVDREEVRRVRLAPELCGAEGGRSCTGIT